MSSGFRFRVSLALVVDKFLGGMERGDGRGGMEGERWKGKMEGEDGKG